MTFNDIRKSFPDNDDGFKEMNDFANKVSLVKFAEMYGVDIRQKKGNTWFIYEEWDKKNHKGVITEGIGNNNEDLYNMFNGGGGGNAIIFAQKHLGLEYKQAIVSLFEVANFYVPINELDNNKDFKSKINSQAFRNSQAFKKTEYYSKVEQEEPKEVIVPQDDYSTKEIFEHLTKERGLDEKLINHLIEKKDIKQVRTPNPKNPKWHFKSCAFLGYDYKDKSKVGFCSVKSMYKNPETGKRFSQDITGSTKKTAFRVQGSSKSPCLKVFESPIDALSHITLCKLFEMKYNEPRISLSGVSDMAIEEFLKHNPQIKQIEFCLDNDNAGQVATADHMKKYEDLGYDVKSSVPNTKDWNDDLLDMRENGFIMQGKSDVLLIFDTPPNAIAHLQLCTLYNKDTDDNRLALCDNNNNAIDKYLENNPNIKEVVVCFNGDNQEKADNICNKIAQQGFNTSKQIPLENSFKEDLKVKKLKTSSLGDKLNDNLSKPKDEKSSNNKDKDKSKETQR